MVKVDWEVGKVLIVLEFVCMNMDFMEREEGEFVFRLVDLSCVMSLVLCVLNFYKMQKLMNVMYMKFVGVDSVMLIGVIDNFLFWFWKYFDVWRR